MKNGISGMVVKLRAMGVEPSVLASLMSSIKSAVAPKLDDAVVTRLREVAATHHRAMLVLGRNGTYSVFTPEGHAALQATARKHKPWAARSKAIRAARTHKPAKSGKA